MLKQLIQWLLDSRTTPSEASHSSYPDDGTVTQFSPSATSVSSWTKVVDSTIAPSDGYVIVRGKATGESYVQITAGDNPPHMERSTFAKTALNQYPILNLPIAKGKTFKVFAENTAEITVGLIKSIGGGYNHLVRRALSCLRPSFNYSLRNFLRISLSGLADKHFHPAGSTSLLPSHSMFRQVTASWDFISRVITLTKRLTYTTMAPAETLSLVPRFQRRQRAATQSLEQSPLRKVTVLLSAVHSLSYGSHQRWEANSNLSTGGALC